MRHHYGCTIDQSRAVFGVVAGLAAALALYPAVDRAAHWLAVRTATPITPNYPAAWTALKEARPNVDLVSVEDCRPDAADYVTLSCVVKYVGSSATNFDALSGKAAFRLADKGWIAVPAF